MVQSIDSSNIHVITEHVIVKSSRFLRDPSVLVRSLYAQVLGELAEISIRFLDKGRNIARKEKGLHNSDMAQLDDSLEHTSDVAHERNRSLFEDQVTLLLADPSTTVRRALLLSMSALCVFLGMQRSKDLLLSHLVTYLNDWDWQLRASFFTHITGVALYLGTQSVEDFIMPLVLQFLADPEAAVVEKVLEALAKFANMGILNRTQMRELCEVCGIYLLHPNRWLRAAAVSYITMNLKWYDEVDMQCNILPLISPYLHATTTGFDQTMLLTQLRKPLSRVILETAVTWAVKSGSSHFWRTVREGRTQSLSGHAKSAEDEQWILKLRGLGLEESEDWKLMMLAEYIWKSSRARDRLVRNSEVQSSGGRIDVKTLKVTPTTIFFTPGTQPENLDPDLVDGLSEKAIAEISDKEQVAFDSYATFTSPSIDATPVGHGALPRQNSRLQDMGDTKDHKLMAGLEDPDGGGYSAGYFARAKAVAKTSTNEQNATAVLDIPPWHLVHNHDHIGDNDSNYDDSIAILSRVDESRSIPSHSYGKITSQNY